MLYATVQFWWRLSSLPAQAVRSCGMSSLAQQHNSAVDQLIQRLLVIDRINEGRGSALWHQQTVEMYALGCL